MQNRDGPTALLAGNVDLLAELIIQQAEPRITRIKRRGGRNSRIEKSSATAALFVVGFMPL